MSAKPLHTHGLILDVSVLSEVMPAEIGYGPKYEGLGKIANKLGPVMLVSRTKEEMDAWKSTDNGAHWQREFQSGGNGLFIEGEISNRLLDSSLTRFGVGWGKVVVSKDEKTKKEATDVGLAVVENLLELSFGGEMLVDERGVVGESGPQSWSNTLEGFEHCHHLGTSVLMHDYHVMDGGDLERLLDLRGKDCHAVHNICALLNGLGSGLPISRFLITTALSFGIWVDTKNISNWTKWCEAGLIEWVGKCPGINDLPDPPMFSVRLTPKGLKKIRVQLSDSLRLNQLGHVELSLIAMDVPNKEAAHSRFFLSDYATGVVDPTWRLFRGKDLGWWFRLSAFTRELGSSQSGLKDWRHFLREVGRAMLKTHKAKRLIRGIDQDGKEYTGILECMKMPFPFIRGMSWLLVYGSDGSVRKQTANA